MMAHEGRVGPAVTLPPVARSRPERRLIGRALTYWENVRGCRRLPRYADVCGGWKTAHEASLYLIEVGDDESGDTVVHAGAALGDALGRDPVGRPATKVLPSSTELGLSFCRAVVAMKKPIADVGRFTNASGQEICYRSILLPLSDDEDRVNFVLGAFSYKREY